MQYYREHAKYLERTYDFVERIGIERLRAVLVDDAEGIGARLDADDAEDGRRFVDPWLEAHQPVHPVAVHARCCRPGAKVEVTPMSAVVGTHAARQVNLGPLDRIPIGEGRTFDVDGARHRRVPPAIGRGVRDAGVVPARQRPARRRPRRQRQGRLPASTRIASTWRTGCPEGNTCAPLTTYPAGVTTEGDVVVTLGGR